MNSSPPSGNQSWRRQAAIFGAAASAITGLGVVLVIYFTHREADRRAERRSPETHSQSR